MKLGELDDTGFCLVLQRRHAARVLGVFSVVVWCGVMLCVLRYVALCYSLL